MKVLIAVASIMVNVMAGQDTQCLPNGCFYDQEEDLTREISCRLDGRQRVLYYHGNNGCDLPKYLLGDATYISPLNNPCCKSKPGKFEPVACGGACIKDSECDKGCASCAGNICKNVQGELSAGELVELGELSDFATKYKITVDNDSGISQTVVIYQENPITDSGYPIIFSSVSVSKGGSGGLYWSIDWGLSWSSGSSDCTPLSGGAEYSRNGPVIAVVPESNSINGAFVSYNPVTTVFDITSETYTDINVNTNGQIETN